MTASAQPAHSTRINPRLVRRLNHVAEDLSGMGLELFVFGSVARTYPVARKGADLDLGIRSKTAMPHETKLERMRYARRKIEDLPTVRPVDLVDFDDAGADFVELALMNRLEFPLDEYGSNDA